MTVQWNSEVREMVYLANGETHALDIDKVYRVFDRDLQEHMVFVYLSHTAGWTYLFAETGEIQGDNVRGEDVVAAILEDS